MRWKISIGLGCIVLGAYWHFARHPVVNEPGITVTQAPIQQVSHQPAFQFKAYTVYPLASFKIQARVLSAKHYIFDHESTLSPVDLALGWGRMSDKVILSQIQIRQANRFYYWRVAQWPIPRAEIETHSANMHMIPADDALEDTLKSIKVGQIVTITGWLVEAKQANGWHWRSSLTRNDTGAGACELVFVQSLELH